MPSIKTKRSCGHGRLFGSECPVCVDIKKGYLEETTENGVKSLRSIPKAERGHKKKEAKELETTTKAPKKVVK